MKFDNKNDAGLSRGRLDGDYEPCKVLRAKIPSYKNPTLIIHSRYYLGLQNE